MLRIARKSQKCHGGGFLPISVDCTACEDQDDVSRYRSCFTPHRAIKPPLPFVNFRDKRRVLHRIDPPDLRSDIDFAAASAQPRHDPTCGYVVCDQEQPAVLG